MSRRLRTAGLAWAAMTCTACGTDDTVAGSLCEPTSGVVARAIDGDTVELEDETRVRYLLVDTPEIGDTVWEHDCFAAEARELNRQLVVGQEVELRYDDDQCTDMFGRALAYIFVNERSVNAILLERGHARVFIPDPRPANHPGPYERESEFLALEAAAREAHKGLWGVCE